MTETLKWQGSLDRLKQAVTFIGRTGDWVEEDALARFRGHEGDVITFWSLTGSVSIQGKNPKALAAELASELGLQKNTLDLD
ncbi:MAG TPA: hypothetical protein VIL30_11495 [Ramlibacter sp.]|jgi:hypothetical protein